MSFEESVTREVKAYLSFLAAEPSIAPDALRLSIDYLIAAHPLLLKHAISRAKAGQRQELEAFLLSLESETLTPDCFPLPILGTAQVNLDQLVRFVRDTIDREVVYFMAYLCWFESLRNPKDVRVELACQFRELAKPVQLDQGFIYTLRVAMALHEDFCRALSRELR